MVDRDRRLNIRVSDEEIAMLEALAATNGVSSSDVIRMLVRRAHAEAFGTKSAAKK